jgi:quinolinate synthase
VAERLSAELPHKNFYTPAKQKAVCPNMKMTTLDDIKRALLGHVKPITIAPSVFLGAKQSLEAMMALPALPFNEAEGWQNAGSAACRCKSPQ